MRRMAEYPFDKSRISLGFLSGIDQIDHARVKLETKFFFSTQQGFLTRDRPPGCYASRNCAAIQADNPTDPKEKVAA